MAFQRMIRGCFLIALPCIFLTGCKKSSEGPSTDTGLGDAKPVVLSITDISVKGDFNEQGLKKLDAAASEPAIPVVVSRTRINDGAMSVEFRLSAAP